MHAVMKTATKFIGMDEYNEKHFNACSHEDCKQVSFTTLLYYNISMHAVMKTATRFMGKMV